MLFEKTVVSANTSVFFFRNLTVGDTSALMETLNSLCARAEMNAADMHQNAASLLENIGSQNLLGDFNLLESLREDEKKELRSG